MIQPLYFEGYMLRLLTVEDTEPYFQMVERNRKRLEDFFTGTVSRTQTREEATRFVAEIVQKSVDRLYFPFLLIDTEHQAFAGFFDWKNIDWNIPKTETGFYMDAQYAGKGIATKALACLTDYGLNEMGFQKIFLRTHPSNLPAQKMAEKCGFEKEGIIRKDYKTTAGELVDLVYYGKLK